MSWLVRVQADDFFNAYQVLRENDNAAMGKLEKLSGKPLVSKRVFGVLPTMAVTVVCLAFSVELYIKDLHLALNGKAPRGHNILKLYEQLPEQIRQEIFAHDAINQNPSTTRGDMFSPKYFSNTYSPYERFLDQIKEISDGFEKWRYSYETNSLRYEEWFALALTKAVKSTADAIRARSAT